MKEINNAVDLIHTSLIEAGQKLRTIEADILSCNHRSFAGFPVVTNEAIPTDEAIMYVIQRDDQGNERYVVLGKIINIGGEIPPAPERTNKI